MNHNTVLLISTLVAVLGLVLLIAKFKLNAFVALIVASIFVGICSGIDLPREQALLHLQGIGQAFSEGVGNVLRSVAMVVGLGTILGKLLEESGGAEVIARRLISKLGSERLPWAMLLIAFLVGIPVWFTVGLVLLVPILFTLIRETGKPMLLLGIPVLAGLSAAHSLVPPHPGPLAAIGVLKADAGKTILYSLLIGFPAAVIAGPLFGKFISRRVAVAAPAMSGLISANAPCSNALTGQGESVSEEGQTMITGRTGRAGEGQTALLQAPASVKSLTPVLPSVAVGDPKGGRRLPGFGVTVFTILLPVMLMMGASAADLFMNKQSAVRAWLDFVGHPTVAMLLAVLLCFYTFGIGLGFSKEDILKFSNDCLGPVALVLLVVGAGGGFSKTLEYSGVGKAMTEAVVGSHFSPLFLGWLLATLLRLATGSATVSISTAAGIMAPVVAALPGTNLELLVIAMGAGSGIFSHLNDGGFWFVKEYLNMTVPQTLKTWTVMTTIKSLVALALVFILNSVFAAT